MTTRFRPLPFLALLAAACDPQAGPDYTGDTMAELHGSVTGTIDMARERLVVAWLTPFETYEADEDQVFLVPFDHASEGLTSSFTMTLFEPPPAEIIYEHVAMGLIAVVDRDVPVGQLVGHESQFGAQIAGLAERNLLFYTEMAFGEAPFDVEAGYHLLEVSEQTAKSRAQGIAECEAAYPDDEELREQCISFVAPEFTDRIDEAPEGFDTRIVVQLGSYDELRVPLH